MPFSQAILVRVFSSFHFYIWSDLFLPVLGALFNIHLSFGDLLLTFWSASLLLGVLSLGSVDLVQGVWHVFLYRYHLSSLLQGMDPACHFDGICNAVNYLGLVRFSYVRCFEFLHEFFNITNIAKVLADLYVGRG